jgi:hypothetical protein
MLRRTCPISNLKAHVSGIRASRRNAISQVTHIVCAKCDGAGRLQVSHVSASVRHDGGLRPGTAHLGVRRTRQAVGVHHAVGQLCGKGGKDQKR